MSGILRSLSTGCVIAKVTPMAARLAAASRAQEDDAWRPLRLLVGEGQDTGSGCGSVSEFTHVWQLVI